MQVDKSKIFSQEALDKLRSPEKLDTMLPITTPITWMALVSMLVLLFSVVLWSIYGSFTVKVDGMGLIMDSEGVVNISHAGNGTIAHIFIKAGTPIKKGDVIAHVKKYQEEALESVYSDYDGIVEKVMVEEGSQIFAGKSICSVRIMQDRNELIGLFYIPLDKGKRVKPGMLLNLEPNGVDVAQSGNLLGVVHSVSQYPMTFEEMQEHLDNAQLAQWILQAQHCPVMEVTFKLIRDPDSESGYLWTSKAEAHSPITPGSFCTGFIIIERQPPIEKVFYRFNKWLRQTAPND